MVVYSDYTLGAISRIGFLPNEFLKDMAYLDLALILP
jgi:hypothetical protein